MFRFKALPDVDEVQAVQSRAPGLLVQLVLYVGFILGEHVLPAAPHDHLKGTEAISAGVSRRPAAQWAPPGDGTDASPAWRVPSSVRAALRSPLSSLGRGHRDPTGAVVWASGGTMELLITSLPCRPGAWQGTPTAKGLLPRSGPRAQTHPLPQLNPEAAGKCPRFPNKKSDFFAPRPHGQEGAEPGFEPEAPADPGPGALRLPQSPRRSLQKLPLPTGSGRVPAGPRPRQGGLGQPSWEPGERAGSVCVVTARLILPTARPARAEDAGLFVFLGSPCLKS